MIKRVLIDLSTQRDFLCWDGAVPVLNCEALWHKLHRAMAWARLTHTPVISALDSKRNSESFEGVPRHCLEGTPGFEKIPFTLMSHRLFLQVDNTLSVPQNLFQSFSQVLLRKRCRDFLSNPKAERLLTETPVGEYVILGVGLETSIKSLALGLIARLKRAAVVYDACGYWNVSAADMALRQMEAKGCRLISVQELVRMRRSYPGRNGHGNVNGGRNGHGNGNGRAHGRRAHEVHDPGVPIPAFVQSRLAALEQAE